MHYNKLIKLAVYLKSSENYDAYFDLVKLAIASQGRFQALVMGAYPSGEKNELGQYDYTMLNEARRKRDLAVSLVNDVEETNANIPALVNIINSVERLREQDNLSFWSEGLKPKHVQELQTLLSRPAQREPQRPYSQERYDSPRGGSRGYSWGRFVASEILERLAPLISSGRYMVQNIANILNTEIYWVVKGKRGVGLNIFTTERDQYYSGKIVNYYPKEKRLRVFSDGRYTYLNLNENLLRSNFHKNNEFLQNLMNSGVFMINIPRSNRMVSEAFLIDAYILDNGVLELVTQWPPEEGQEKDKDMFVKKFRSDDGSLDDLFRMNPSLFA